LKLETSKRKQTITCTVETGKLEERKMNLRKRKNWIVKSRKLRKRKLIKR
jgi:hypothetical protein